MLIIASRVATGSLCNVAMHLHPITGWTRWRESGSYLGMEAR